MYLFTLGVDAGRFLQLALGIAGAAAGLRITPLGCGTGLATGFGQDFALPLPLALAFGLVTTFGVGSGGKTSASAAAAVAGGVLPGFAGGSSSDS